MSSEFTPRPASEGDKWHTKGEAAAYCRRSVRTIDRWMQRGWLRFARTRSGQIVFRLNDLKSAMDKQWNEDAGKAERHPPELG